MLGKGTGYKFMQGCKGKAGEGENAQDALGVDLLVEMEQVLPFGSVLRPLRGRCSVMRDAALLYPSSTKTRSTRFPSPS